MEENVDLANTMESKFRFSIIVAKRAKQLINGAKQLVDIGAQNPLTIAIEEVKQGLITIEMLGEVNIFLKESNLLAEDEAVGDLEVSGELSGEDFSMDKVNGSEELTDAEGTEDKGSGEPETGKKEE